MVARPPSPHVWMADPWGSPFTLGTVDVACSLFVYLLLRCVPQKELYSIHDMEQRVERLVELNVMEQVCLPVLHAEPTDPCGRPACTTLHWQAPMGAWEHPTHTHLTTHHFAVLALG